MLQILPDDKRSTILCSALQVFVAYGFRKTSMDDIARAAGMSRPALYQVFKNKTDIFRGLAAEMMADAERKARAGFSMEGTFREKLHRAMDMSILEMHRFVEQTAHGKELVGISHELASDISEEWTDALAEIVADGIQQASAQGMADLSRFHADAQTIARIFTLALEGLKNEVEKDRPVEPRLRALADFIADAIEPAPRSAGWV